MTRKPSSRKRRYSRSTGELTDLIIRLVVLGAILFGSTVMAWFNQRPWALPWAAFTMGAGLLGLIAFFLTWTQMRRQEAERRRILEQDWRRFSPSEFEHYVAGLFRSQGYRARVTGRRGDGGIDIQLEKDGEQAIVQCKQYLSRRSVGVKDMREFSAVLDRSGAKEGYFVTAGYFSAPALDWARNEPIIAVDGDELANWAREARNGPYAEPVKHPLYFSTGQWLTLTLLGTTAVGVFGFLAGVLMLG